MLDLKNTRTKFWLRSSSWPIDSSAFVFLGRAIDAIGKSMFHEHWKGWQDAVVEYTPAFPKQQPLEPNNITRQAYSLLAKYKPEFGLSRIDPGTPPSDIKRLTNEQWAAATELHIRVSEAIDLRGSKRFAEVQKAIVRSAEAGKLETAIRPIPGGDFTPVPASWWNSERLEVRFEMCQMNPNDPFGYGVAGDSFCWIFVSRKSLNDYIAEPEARKSAETTTASGSSDDLTMFYGLVPRSGKKQQLVYAAIRETWKDGRVPRMLTIGQIQEKINPVVRRMGDAGGASEDNIRRALGLK
jgi:hypothetical protein